MTPSLAVGEQSSQSPTVWPIDEIVDKLSEVRRRSLEARNRLQKPTILPSRDVLSRIVEKLSLVMFPNRLGSRALAPNSIDYFVGQLLDVTLNELLQQAEIEIKFANHEIVEDAEAREQAIAIVRTFALGIPKIRSLLDKISRQLSTAIRPHVVWMKSWPVTLGFLLCSTTASPMLFLCKD